MWRSGPRLMGKRFYLLSTYRFIYVEKWPSGQWQQTVNLSAQAFAGSNPAFSTILRSASFGWQANSFSLLAQRAAPAVALNV